VGLSTGITPTLTAGGKLVIIGCMFIGRLGPLLIADSLIGRRPPVPYSLPEEDIMIG
jgi:trk system potassium uptake protein